VIETEACGKRDALLCKASEASSPIGPDWNTIERDTQVIPHDLEFFVVSAIQPG
jgi:hypothetical protein